MGPCDIDQHRDNVFAQTLSDQDTHQYVVFSTGKDVGRGSSAITGERWRHVHEKLSATGMMWKQQHWYVAMSRTMEENMPQ